MFLGTNPLWQLLIAVGIWPRRFTLKLLFSIFPPLFLLVHVCAPFLFLNVDLVARVFSFPVRCLPDASPVHLRFPLPSLTADICKSINLKWDSQWLQHSSLNNTYKVFFMSVYSFCSLPSCIDRLSFSKREFYFMPLAKRWERLRQTWVWYSCNGYFFWGIRFCE